MEAIAVAIAITIVALVLMYLYFKRLIRRELEYGRLVEKLRNEIRTLVAELNESADRNITLIEDRIKTARELMERAEKRIGLLSRETEKKTSEREVYVHLGAVGRGAPYVRREAAEVSSDPRVAGTSAEGRDGGSEVRRAAIVGNSVESQDGDIDVRRAAYSASGEAQIGAGQGRREETRRGPGDDERKPPIVTHYAIPEEDWRESAQRLSLKGFSADIIAAKLGRTVAEVELSLSLSAGKAERKIL